MAESEEELKSLLMNYLQGSEKAGEIINVAVTFYKFAKITIYNYAWVNNLRYADDTTLMAESEEELKSLLMKVKRRVKKLA